MNKYNNDELKKLQLIQLGMLRKLTNYFKEHDIEYFVIAGTALGAKRHSGFIPWDDDIDIGMTRINYERFISNATKEFFDDMFLQLPKTDLNSPFGFAKVRLNHTLFIEYSYQNVSMHKGIYIDIFPFDRTTENYNEMQKHFDNVLFWNKLNIYKRVPNITEPSTTLYLKVKQVIRKLVNIGMKIIPNDYLLKKMNQNTSKYNETDSNVYANLYSSIREYISEDDLYPLQEVKFEDITVFAPANLDKYLTNLYGEYNTLPPKEKRVGHKPTIIKF